MRGSPFGLGFCSFVFSAKLQRPLEPMMTLGLLKTQPPRRVFIHG
jgi:hypothetical protein